MSTYLNSFPQLDSSEHPLLDEVLEKIPQADQRIASVICQHGASSRWSALRELVSNAIDATRETGESALPAVQIRLYDRWIEVEDRGCGMADRLTRLLLRPGLTTKANKQRIGRMGVGFLGAVSAMTAVAVWSRPAGARQWASLTLGQGPWHEAGPPGSAHGTLVRAVFREGAIRRNEMRRFLEHEFPFIPVELWLDGQPLTSYPSPWTTGMDWRPFLRDVLQLPSALWSDRFLLAEELGSAILWVPHEPDERGGRAIVFQAGVLLQSGLERSSAVTPIATLPPWLLAVVDAPGCQPTLTRTAIAAGASQRALSMGIERLVQKLIAHPPEKLLAQVPKIQAAYPSSFVRWCQELHSEHPILLATQWATSNQQGICTLAGIQAYEGLTLIVSGDSVEVDMLWQDYCRLAAQQPLYVRAHNSDAAELLLRVLRDGGRQAERLGFRAQQRIETTPRLAPEFIALANSLSAALLPLAITVEPVRMHSTSLLGLLEPCDLQSGAIIEQDLLAPRSSRILYLNASSHELLELARCRQAQHRDSGTVINHDEAIVLLSCIVAQAQLGSHGINRVPQALAQSLWRRRHPVSIQKTARRHARVLLLCPFRDSQILLDLRTVLEAHPFYAELVRADDWKDVSQVWEDVQAKVQDADAYIFDLRTRSANVLVELGYVLAYAPQRPFVIISEPNWDLANIGALLTLRPPQDPATASSYFAKHLSGHGLSPERLASAEPFLSTRHLPSELKSEMERHLALSDHLDLYTFATGAPPPDVSLRRAQCFYAERIKCFNSRFDQEPSSESLTMTRRYPEKEY